MALKHFKYLRQKSILGRNDFILTLKQFKNYNSFYRKNENFRNRSMIKIECKLSSVDHILSFYQFTLLG